jgi:hypothetical protein
MTWEVKDRIALAALIVSIVALLLAGASAVFSVKQYWLNEARDQRDREASLPGFEHHVQNDQPGRSWAVRIEAENHSAQKLFVDVVFADFPQDMMFMPTVRYDVLGSAALVNPFPDGIAGHGSSNWTGYLVMHPQAAGAGGKLAEFRYEYHFAGEESRSHTGVVKFRLPGS